jgi:hypothetical protein
MKTESSMLKYVKTILDRMSFDRRLFRKEYRKSLSWLSKDEVNELRFWLRQQKLSLIK